MKQKRIGDHGETVASAFLETLGHEILARNWRSGRLEIDIISRIDSTIVFTEVKVRNDVKYGLPEEFVDPAKQKRMVAAATDWMMKHEWEGEIRFDIVGFYRISQNGTPEIIHIEDAFFPFDDLES